jgi:hypothetical protein
MALGVSQQVLLIPVFLHFWTSDVLAAWLAIYAAGSLVLIADGGLQIRAINRFLAFKASVDCDGRTGQFYASMMRVYFSLVTMLAAPLLIAAWLLPPSRVLGFTATAHFDAAFVVITVGTLMVLPSNLTSALYRTRGSYARAIWLQSAAMFFAQLMQLLAVIATGSLLAVAVAYASVQVFAAIYFVAFDGPRLFPHLRGRRASPSLRWCFGQIRLGFPFGFAGAADMALLNAPVLLVSVFVSGRVAVVQWALTRVIAGLVRMLCLQATLPLSAELGHDHAIGARDRLRDLYARGSVFVTLLASLTVSALLPFWPDFLALWTHGTIPYDPLLTITLLLGSSAAAPSILALGYANCSNQGDLLVRTKAIQLALFVVLSVLLIPPMGPLGAAIAIVASDLLVQSGFMASVIISRTLRHPSRHVAFLAAIWLTVVGGGWVVGEVIGWLVPGTGAIHLVAECALWLIVVGLLVSPLAIKRVRNGLIAAVPR